MVLEVLMVRVRFRTKKILFFRGNSYGELMEEHDIRRASLHGNRGLVLNIFFNLDPSSWSSLFPSHTHTTTPAIRLYSIEPFRVRPQEREI